MQQAQNYTVVFLLGFVLLVVVGLVLFFFCFLSAEKIRWGDLNAAIA